MRKKLRPRQTTAFGEKLIEAITRDPATRREVFRKFELHLNKTTDFAETLDSFEAAEKLKEKL